MTENLTYHFRKVRSFFYLGEKAEVWADKIKNPKSIIDKLGIKPTSRVVVPGIADEKFLGELSKRTKFMQKKLAKELDFIFYSAESVDDLGKLSSLKTYLKEDGAIWVVSRKGKEATLKDTEVMAEAKKAGLIDNKVVGFSPTHTALKLVIPKDQRNT